MPPPFKPRIVNMYFFLFVHNLFVFSQEDRRKCQKKEEMKRKGFKENWAFLTTRTIDKGL